MRKSLIKLHFIFTILLILGLSLFAFANYFYDQFTFFASMGLTQELIQQYLPLLIRIWVANLGISSFLAILSYAMEEEMSYTAKTALYTFIFNIVYAVLLILLLRKLLKKPPMSILGGL